MSTCAWPDKACPRPVRANGMCASHDVMWARRYGREATPKKRGVKAKAPLATGNALTRPHLHRLLVVLRAGPLSLQGITEAYGRSQQATCRALRQIEASGLQVERTANGREVLRHVTKEEAARYLLSISGVTAEAG